MSRPGSRRRRVRRALCAVAAAALATSATHGPATAAAALPDGGSAARFDWFEYRGDDPVFRAGVAAGHYQNPILAGFYPDPSIVRHGRDYYLVNSSFAYFPGVPIFHSRDLVHWTQLGYVLDRRSQLALDSVGTSRGVFAPTIREHDGTFYMITTVVERGNFLVTAKDPAGPWSDPVWLPQLEGAIDPSLFFDDDGRAYVVNNGPPEGTPRYSGHRAIWVQEYDVARQRMTGPRKLIVDGGVDIATKPIWIEAPHIVKRGGRYYLICAEGGTAAQHSEVVFRSDAPMGPYVPGPRNPILTQRQLDPARLDPITSTGHADFVDTPDGQTWAVFLGTRPYGDDLYNTGRETFLLPVRWVDGWPVILEGWATVPWTPRRPALAAEPPPRVPTTGNFTLRDGFDGARLAPYWEMLRTPRDSFIDLRSTPGALTLRAGRARLGAPMSLSFVGRRQQHANATATVAMRYTPTRAGDEAGLVAYESDDFNYFVGVTLAGGRPVVRLVERAGPLTGDSAVVLAETPLHAAAGAPVYLRVAARGGRYDFFFATRPGRWVALERDADGTILSTRVAGGFSSNFVGVTFGMYAHRDAP